MKYLSYGLVVSVLVLSAFFAFNQYIYTEKQAEHVTEAVARGIAEQSCIKGGEALGLGIYDEGKNEWLFVANLNATREKCIAVCAVDAKTQKAEIEWRCEE